MAKKDERREFHRHDTRFSLRLGADAAGAAEALATNGLNISMGGIYCKVPHFIPMMTKIQATLLLPIPVAGGGGVKEEALRADMIVVWTDPEGEVPGIESYQIGCSFLPLEEEKKNLLRLYLDSLEI